MTSPFFYINMKNYMLKDVATSYNKTFSVRVHGGTYLEVAQVHHISSSGAKLHQEEWIKGPIQRCRKYKPL